MDVTDKIPPPPPKEFVYVQVGEDVLSTFEGSHSSYKVLIVI